MLKKFDKVKLIEKFENERVYIVAEIKQGGLVHLFPESGGFLCAAMAENLEPAKGADNEI